MKIILFRHGEKQRIESTLLDDKKGVGLTDFGIIQVNKLANALSKNFPSLKSSSIIYSSPYKRTLQSAEIIKSVLNIKEIITVPEFGELMAYTNYQNPKEFRKHLQGLAMQNLDWVSPETNNSFKNLISDFLNKLKEISSQNSSEIVLVSTHGGLIRNTVYFLDSKIKPSDDLIEEAKIHEAGYTILNFDGQNFTIDKFDICDHL
jgi:broad specificity phosphatase PhoE